MSEKRYRQKGEKRLTTNAGNKRASVAHLKPFKPGPEQSEMARLAGIKSGEAKREKKIIREALERKLGGKVDEVVEALIQQAIRGNVPAFLAVRDTAGEKPVEKVEQIITEIPFEIKIVR